MIEDAVVIYRISRAPERRIFYIDVGNLPKIKAEQYLRDIMNKYKNKLVYDSQSGEIKDDRKQPEGDTEKSRISGTTRLSIGDLRPPSGRGSIAQDLTGQ